VTTLELVEALAAKGVRLYAEGGDLKYRGPRSALAPETIARLKAHKPEIVVALTATPTPPPQEPPAPEEPAALSAFAKRKLEQASEMGLVAMWSRHHGYVSVHDPTTGEWHDLRTGDAPDWAVPEARRRKWAREGGGA
jgi:hypothetical protein